MIRVWHQSGEKYFGYLSDSLSIDFVNPHIFRHLLGKGKFAVSRKVGKLSPLADINIVCLLPGDLNIILFIFKKLILLKKVTLIWHTSYPTYEDMGLIKNSWIRIWFWLLNNFFDEVVTPIPAVTQTLRDYTNLKITLIHHPINLPRQDGPYCAKKHLRVFGFLGEKTFPKGIDRVINLARVNKEFEFILSGPGQIVEKDLPRNVSVKSQLNRDEVRKFIDSIDVLLVPSRRYRGWQELFGIVIIEALNSNRLVIASSHVGPKYISKFTNLLYLVNDDEDWNKLDLARMRYPETLEQNLEEFRLQNCIQKWRTILDNST